MLFKELNSLMSKYSFRPSKKKSQHFLVDEKIIEKIVSAAALTKTDLVLEIGSGTGFLTRSLQEKAGRVIATELDASLCALLRKELRQENLQLLEGNFLSLQLPEFNKVVATPPYGISSEIMYRLFSFNLELAVLVFQSDFVEKLVSEPGFENYCALSVLSQHYFEPEVLGAISSESFFPKPKSASAIIRLVSRQLQESAERKLAFQHFVKTLFRFKNKNLRNALKLGSRFLEKEQKLSAKSGQILEELGIGEQKVCQIEVQKFEELFSKLCK